MSGQNEEDGYNSNQFNGKNNGYFENPQNLNQYSYSLNNPLTLTDPTGELTEKTTDNVIYASGAILVGGVVFIVSAIIKSPQGLKAGATTIYESGEFAISQIWNDPDMADVKEGTEEFLADVVDAAQDYASDFWEGTKELIYGDD
jgi:hypothetical protein